MRVTHINFSEARSAGAATAMGWIQKGTEQLGIETHTVCGRMLGPPSAKATVIPRSASLENGLSKITRRLGLNDIHCLSSFQLNELPAVKGADLLHFHILHSGFFNYLALPKLTRSCSSVYTFHDMWGFTGHCSYSYDCNRWQKGCGHCPRLETEPSIHKDATHWEWKLKKRIYRSSRFAVAAPSRWLTEKAKSSPLLQGKEIHHIPYGIDTETYRPQDATALKRDLGLREDRVGLLFSAANFYDHRKGADLLAAALKQLAPNIRSRIQLMVMGQDIDAFLARTEFPTLALGYIHSDQRKAEIYSAADLFLLPTRADNQPCGILESMSCGTPVISFDVGGVGELVQNGITGLTASGEDSNGLTRAIEQLVADHDMRLTLGRQAKEWIEKHHGLERQARDYQSLYESLLQSA